MAFLTKNPAFSASFSPDFNPTGFRSADLYVWATGQSNIAYEYTQYSGAGAAAFNTEAALYFSGTIQNRNKSVGGSSLSEWVSSGVLQTYGEALLTDMAANPPASGAAVAVRWNWGEQNGADGLDKATIKSECLAMFTAWRAVYPSMRIFIDMLGTRATNVNETYWQNVKDAYFELIAENSWIYKGAERYDLALVDNQHLGEVGCETQAERAARRIAASYGLRTQAGTLGPSMLSAAIVSPSVIEITLDHDAGTDFTPTSAIEAVDILIGGTAQTTPTVSRKDANTLSVLMAEGEAPLASETTVIYNNYGQQVGLDKTKVVVDNASIVMPLQTGKLTVTNSDPVQSLDNLVIYIDPRGCAKTYNTGTRIQTITPIGGTITGAVGPFTATEGPTFDTTAFDNAGGFTFDDVDRELLVGDMGTAGASWTIGMVWEFAPTLDYAYYFFGWGASGGATDAQTLAFMSNTGLIRYSTNEANAIETLYDASALAGERNILFFEYVSASELNLYMVINQAVTKVGTINPRDDYTAYDYMLFFNSSASRIAPINDACGAFFVTRDVLSESEKNAIAAAWIEQFTIVPIITGITYTLSSDASYTATEAGLRDGVFTGADSVIATDIDADTFIRADFGSAKNVKQINLACIPAAFDSWGPEYTNGRTLEYSVNGTDWTTIETISGVVEGVLKTYTVDITARYVRVHLAGGGDYIGLGDFWFRGE